MHKPVRFCLYLYIIAMAFFFGSMSSVSAEEKPVIPAQDVRRAFAEASEIAEKAVEARGKLSSEDSAEQFVRIIAELQPEIEKIVVRIGSTRPPREMQAYAMRVAIATKDVELALWRYLYIAVANPERRDQVMQKADDLLKSGLAEFRALREATGSPASQ